MNKRAKNIVRMIAAALIVTFAAQDVLWANPQAFSGVAPPPARVQSPLIPHSIATVSAKHAASSTKTLYLIQDAHTNESAQLNIAKTLEILVRKEGVSHVFMEAGWGDASLSFLREKALLAHREKTARAFLRKGILSGAEYLDLTSDHKFALWGVEDKALYWKSVEAYRKVAKDREDFENYLKLAEQTVQALKPRIFNPSLQLFDAKREAFLDGRSVFSEYLAALTNEAGRSQIGLATEPHLAALHAVLQKERKIDFGKAQAEQAHAVASLSAEDLELVAAASREKHFSPVRIGGAGQREEKGFYAFLRDKVKDLSAYPELSKYFDYLEEAGKIDAARLLDEQKALESRVYAGLIRTRDEADLHRASEALRNLKRLFSLSLTPDEYASLKTDPAAFDIAALTGSLNFKIMELKSLYERAVFLKDGTEGYVRTAKEFYELTEQRDRAFLESALAKMDEKGLSKAVLIAGGYHTPNLASLLRAQNISYVSLTPQVLQETNQKRYEALLLSQEPTTGGPEADKIGIRLVRFHPAHFTALTRAVEPSSRPSASVRSAEGSVAADKESLASRFLTGSYRFAAMLFLTFTLFLAGCIHNGRSYMAGQENGSSQTADATGSPKKAVRREPMSLLEKLGVASVVAAGSVLLARHSKDDHLDGVLAIDVLSSAVISGIGAAANDQDPFDGALWGAAGGLAMFGGKEIMSHHIEKDGYGFLAKGVHSLGVSMRDNAMRGQGPFDRYEVDFGPVLFGLNFTEDQPVVDLALLPMPLFELGEQTLIKHHSVDWEATSKIGALVFRDKVLDLSDGEHIGEAFANIVTVDKQALEYDKPTRLGILVHEGIHTLQYSEFSALGYPLDRWAHEELDGYLPSWIRLDRDAAEFLLWPLKRIEEDVLDKEHGERFLEREPELWEKKAEKRMRSGGARLAAEFGRRFFLAGGLAGVGLAAGFLAGCGNDWDKELPIPLYRIPLPDLPASIIRGVTNADGNWIFRVDVNPADISAIPDGGSLELIFVNTLGQFKGASIPKAALLADNLVTIDLSNSFGSGGYANASWTISARSRKDTYPYIQRSATVDTGLTVSTITYVAPTLTAFSPSVISGIQNPVSSDIFEVFFDQAEIDAKVPAGGFVKLRFRHYPTSANHAVYIPLQQVVTNGYRYTVDLSQAHHYSFNLAEPGPFAVFAAPFGADESFAADISTGRIVQVSTIPSDDALAPPAEGFIQSVLNSDQDAVWLVQVDPAQTAGIPAGAKLLLHSLISSTGAVSVIRVSASEILPNGIIPIDLTDAGSFVASPRHLIMSYEKLAAPGQGTSFPVFSGQIVPFAALSSATLPDLAASAVTSVQNPGAASIVDLVFDQAEIEAKIAPADLLKLTFRESYGRATKVFHVSRQTLAQRGYTYQVNLSEGISYGPLIDPPGIYSLSVSQIDLNENFSNPVNTGRSVGVSSFVSGARLALSPSEGLAERVEAGVDLGRRWFLNAGVVGFVAGFIAGCKPPGPDGPDSSMPAPPSTPQVPQAPPSVLIQGIINTDQNHILNVLLDINQLSAVPDGGGLLLRFRKQGTSSSYPVSVPKSAIPSDGIIQIDLDRKNPDPLFNNPTGILELHIKVYNNDGLSDATLTSHTTTLNQNPGAPTLSLSSSPVTGVSNPGNTPVVQLAFDPAVINAIPSNGGYVKLEFREDTAYPFTGTTDYDIALRHIYIPKELITANGYIYTVDLRQSMEYGGSSVIDRWFLHAGYTYIAQGQEEQFSNLIDTGFVAQTDSWTSGARLATQDEISSLASELKHKDQAVRNQAIQALYHIGPDAKEAVPALIELLKDRDPFVRWGVAEVLGQIGPGAKDAVPALIDGWKDGSLGERSIVVKVFGQIGPGAKDAVPALIEAFKDGDRPVRDGASQAIIQIGAAAVPALIENFKDEDVRIRSQAVGLVRQIGPAAVPALIESLKVRHLGVRFYAAEALRQIGPAAVPALVEALKESDADVRFYSAEALREMGPDAQEAVPALVEMLKNAEKFDTYPVEQILTRIGPASVPALIEALKYDDPYVRLDAAEILGRIGPDAILATAPLLEFRENFSHGSYDLRRINDALDAIRNTTGSEPETPSSGSGARLADERKAKAGDEAKSWLGLSRREWLVATGVLGLFAAGIGGAIYHQRSKESIDPEKLKDFWVNFEAEPTVDNAKKTVRWTVAWLKDRGYPQPGVLDEFQILTEQMTPKSVFNHPLAAFAKPQDLNTGSLSVMANPKNVANLMESAKKARSSSVFVRRVASMIVREAWGAKAFKTEKEDKGRSALAAQRLIAEMALSRDYDQFVVQHEKEILSLMADMVAHEYFELLQMVNAMRWAEEQGLYSLEEELRTGQIVPNDPTNVYVHKDSPAALLAWELPYLIRLWSSQEMEMTGPGAVFALYRLLQSGRFKQSGGKRGLDPSGKGATIKRMADEMMELYPLLEPRIRSMERRLGMGQLFRSSRRVLESPIGRMDDAGAHGARLAAAGDDYHNEKLREAVDQLNNFFGHPQDERYEADMIGAFEHVGDGTERFSTLKQVVSEFADYIKESAQQTTNANQMRLRLEPINELLALLPSKPSILFAFKNYPEPFTIVWPSADEEKASGARLADGSAKDEPEIKSAIFNLSGRIPIVMTFDGLELRFRNVEEGDKRIDRSFRMGAIPALIKLGGASENDIVIPEGLGRVSKNHAHISIEGDGSIYLTDVSAIGTFFGMLKIGQSQRVKLMTIPELGYGTKSMEGQPVAVQPTENMDEHFKEANKFTRQADLLMRSGSLEEASKAVSEAMRLYSKIRRRDTDYVRRSEAAENMKLLEARQHQLSISIERQEEKMRVFEWRGDREGQPTEDETTYLSALREGKATASVALFARDRRKGKLYLERAGDLFGLAYPGTLGPTISGRIKQGEGAEEALKRLFHSTWGIELDTARLRLIESPNNNRQLGTRYFLDAIELVALTGDEWSRLKKFREETEAVEKKEPNPLKRVTFQEHVGFRRMIMRVVDPGSEKKLLEYADLLEHDKDLPIPPSALRKQRGFKSVYSYEFSQAELDKIERTQEEAEADETGDTKIRRKVRGLEAVDTDGLHEDFLEHPEKYALDAFIPTLTTDYYRNRLFGQKVSSLEEGSSIEEQLAGTRQKIQNWYDSRGITGETREKLVKVVEPFLEEVELIRQDAWGFARAGDREIDNVCEAVRTRFPDTAVDVIAYRSMIRRTAAELRGSSPGGEKVAAALFKETQSLFGEEKVTPLQSYYVLAGIYSDELREQRLIEVGDDLYQLYSLFLEVFEKLTYDAAEIRQRLLAAAQDKEEMKVLLLQIAKRLEDTPPKRFSFLKDFFVRDEAVQATSKLVVSIANSPHEFTQHLRLLLRYVSELGAATQEQQRFYRIEKERVIVHVNEKHIRVPVQKLGEFHKQIVSGEIQYRGKGAMNIAYPIPYRGVELMLIRPAFVETLLSRMEVKPDPVVLSDLLINLAYFLNEIDMIRLANPSGMRDDMQYLLQAVEGEDFLALESEVIKMSEALVQDDMARALELFEKFKEQLEGIHLFRIEQQFPMHTVTLREMMEEKRKAGGFEIRQILRLGGQLARAYQHQARTGIVNRDIKPENIIVSENIDRTRVIDLGISVMPWSGKGKASLTDAIRELEAYRRDRIMTGGYFPGAALKKFTREMLDDPRRDFFSLWVTMLQLLGINPWDGFVVIEIGRQNRKVKIKNTKSRATIMNEIVSRSDIPQSIRAFLMNSEIGVKMDFPDFSGTLDQEKMIALWGRMAESFEDLYGGYSGSVDKTISFTEGGSFERAPTILSSSYEDDTLATRAKEAAGREPALPDSKSAGLPPDATGKEPMLPPSAPSQESPGNGARLANVTVTQKDAITFALEVHGAKQETGRIMLGRHRLKIEMNKSNGALRIHGLAKEPIEIKNYRDNLDALRKVEKPVVALSMTDLRQALGQDVTAVDAALAEIDTTVPVVMELDLAAFRGTNAEELAYPLLVRELNIARKLNAVVLLRGEANEVEEVSSQADALYAAKQNFIYKRNEEIPQVYRSGKRIRVVSADDDEPLQDGEGRRFYLKPLGADGLHNLNAIFKTAIFEARIEKLETSDPRFVRFLEAYRILLGRREIADVSELIGVLSGANKNLAAILRYAVQPKPIPLNALVRVYELMKRMAEQAA